MKLFYASPVPRPLITRYFQRFLESYLVLKGDRLEKFITKYPIKELFIDSGAFTAYTLGTIIKIEDYITYIHKNNKYIAQYANLDVIGNEKKTYENYLEMKKSGLKPIPVFHQFENNKYLHKYLEDTDYIALGGMVGYQPVKLIPFLDTCYSIIKNYGQKKIHGFGISSIRLWERYPFYSCDSTSWIVGSMFAKIIQFKNRHFIGSMKTKMRNKGKMSVIGLKTLITKPEESIYIDYNNLLEFEKAVKYVTDLWKIKGVVWK